MYIGNSVVDCGARPTVKDSQAYLLYMLYLKHTYCICCISSILVVYVWFPKSGEIERLKMKNFCNFEYILSRVHSLSVGGLIGDLEVTLSNILDADVDLVRQALCQSIRVLSIDPLQLASELIGHLRPLKGMRSSLYNIDPRLLGNHCSLMVAYLKYIFSYILNLPC